MKKRSPLFIIFAVVFLDLLGFGIVIPQLGIYGYKFGASGFLVGCLGSIYSAMQFLCAPMLGRLSDRVGRRPVILVSLLGSVAGYLIFGFAGTLLWLFIGRTAQGICGANISTAQAYIADSTPPEERARSLGMYLGAAFGLGFIFGPALGSALSAWGNLGLGLVAAAMSALSFAVAFFFLPESHPPERRLIAPAGAQRRGGLARIGEVLTLAGVGRVVAVFFLVTLAFSMMEGVFSLYVLTHFFGGPTGGARTGPLAVKAGEWTGFLFVTIGVVSTAVQGGLIGRLKRRFGEAKLVAVGVACMALGLSLIPLASSIYVLFPVMAVLALGSGLNSPSLSSLITQFAPGGRQGEVVGVYQSMGSLARAAGPALGGLVFERMGPQMPFFIAGALMAAAVLLGLRLLTLRGHEGAPESVLSP